MNRLVRLYASNFLTTDTIIAASDNLCHLVFDEENQVSDENVGIGRETWVSVAGLEATYDTTPFFTAVRQFYHSSTKTMLKKFPFGDMLLKDLSVLYPENTPSFSFRKLLKDFLKLDWLT